MRIPRQARRSGLGHPVGAVLHLLVLVLLALGLPSAAAAQKIPPKDTARVRRDSTRRDSVVVPAAAGQPDSARVDSLRADSLRRALPPSARTSQVPLLGDSTKKDTLKAPLAHFPTPPSPDVGAPYRWNRAQLFAAGSLTLLDLLEQVPGVTGFRAGWITLPMTAAWLGDAGAIRVWLDGVELDPMNQRSGSAPDLSAIPLWTLEEVVVERGADELRVHLRSWRWQTTTANTRTDVFTGDEDTNMYRGFFAKRYGGGAALQAGAQQFSTSGQRFGGDGDALDFFGRVGWARGRWSLDGFLQRVSRDYDQSDRVDLNFQRSTEPGVPAFTGRWSQAYVRAGWGSADAGPWLQLIGSTLRFSETSPPRSTTAGFPGGFGVDSADTTRSRAQWVLAGGWTVGPLQLTAEDRYRVFEGQHLHTPAARASLDTRYLALSARAEYRAPDELYVRDTINAVVGEQSRVALCFPPRPRPLPASGPADVLYRRRFSAACAGEPPRVSRADVSARLQPFSFLSFAGSAGETRRERMDAPLGAAPEQVRAARGEAGLRLFGVWLSGGALWRDSAGIASPTIFGSEYRYDSIGTRRPVGPETAVFASVRGRLYKAIYADAWGIQWDRDSVPFRPKVQTRASLYLQSNWKRRFPSGSFGILFGATHEYRSFGWFPLVDGTVRRVPQSRVLSSILEIRILNATISWQQRNSLNRLYTLVPGLEMPGQTNLYGVRWDFFN